MKRRSVPHTPTQTSAPLRGGAGSVKAGVESLLEPTAAELEAKCLRIWNRRLAASARMLLNHTHQSVVMARARGEDVEAGEVMLRVGIAAERALSVAAGGPDVDFVPTGLTA